MAKPSVYPSFATDDIVDPVSGQSNVSEPSASKKQAGWDRHETPPRQFMNWIHRLTDLWVQYLDVEVDAAKVRLDSVEADLNAATNINTADTLARRDANGRLRVSDPVDNLDAANKQYVDNAASNASAIPVGTRMLFYQAGVPSKWSLVSSVNDRAVIAVNSGGGSTGGSWTISGLNVGDRTLNLSHMPYGYYFVQNIGGPFPGPVSRDTGSGFSIANGSSNPHNHAISQDGSWRPRHITVIVCQYDG